MKTYLLHIVLFFCITQQLYSQENGVVAFNMPARNSLKFNRQFINPTFSFVREQNKYISFNNKREWVQFDDAPQTYLFGYSGRFRENVGAGISLFQQDYGVLTTFGGVVNFAYNAVLDRDSNLTFGLNLGIYKSGINEGNVVTNFPDSALDNFPSNSIITINPGVNYGIEFLDFGVSLKNLVSYNFTTSKMIEDNPEQGIQAHIMYTGYMNSRGFFDESRFSGIVSSEFKKDQTVLSGMLMLMVPKGIWAQAGYNSLYALSLGVGLNVSPQIAIEYNYEKGVGGFSTFGNSHDITLAYKFKNNYRYNYSGDDDEEALIMSSNKKYKNIAKRRKSTNSQSRKKTKPVAIEKNDVNSEKVTSGNQDKLKDENSNITEAAQAKLAEEARIAAAAAEQARNEELARVKAEEAAQAKLAEEARIVAAAAAAQARNEELARVKAEEAAQVKLAEEARIAAAAAEQARNEELARVKAEEAAQAKLAEEARIEAATAAAAQARNEELARVKAEEAAQAKLAEEARIAAAAAAQARNEELARVKAE
uniref:PorP/SprF family type IX secretion system membrane protein n=1 Tax=uncultured Algibacter sp. TaxID=298659 RepID=UPI002632AB38